MLQKLHMGESQDPLGFWDTERLTFYRPHKTNGIEKYVPFCSRKQLIKYQFLGNLFLKNSINHEDICHRFCEGNVFLFGWLLGEEAGENLREIGDRKFYFPSMTSPRMGKKYHKSLLILKSEKTYNSRIYKSKSINLVVM